MKLLIFLLILFFTFSATGGNGRNFRRKHGEGSRIEVHLKKLVSRLLSEGSVAKGKIEKARKKKVSAYNTRVKKRNILKGITTKRFASEAAYNFLMKEERKADKALKSAETHHRDLVKVYGNTFRDQHKEIDVLNHELEIVWKIRNLLGLQHSGKHERITIGKEKFHANGNNMKTHSYKKSNYHVGTKLFKTDTPRFCANMGTTLKIGKELKHGQCLVSSNGKYTAVFQHDGNFVIYSGGTVAGTKKGVVWSSNTYQSKNTKKTKFIFQSDGNIVIYKISGAAWYTRTNGKGARTLVMQNDRNLVVYNKNMKPLWDSKTVK